MTTSSSYELMEVIGEERAHLRNLCRLFDNSTPDFQYKKLPEDAQRALVESAVLHAKALADFLLSYASLANGAKLSDFFQDRGTLEPLTEVYGEDATEGSGCWLCNQMLQRPLFLPCPLDEYIDLVMRINHSISCVMRVIWSNIRHDS